MTWSVLDASRPADHARWMDLWWSWPNREIAAHPSYTMLFTEDVQRAVCATWVSESCNIVFPLIMRPISDEQSATVVDGWDLEGPYGYGGPFMWGGTTSGVDAFWEAFEHWAYGIGGATAFARLGLFSSELAPIQRGEVATVQMNIVRGLNVDDAELLRDYEHKVRKNIKRATACGVTVEFDEAGSRLDEFLGVYEATMDRRSASDHYYFERPFFERIREDLLGHYVFAHAILEGSIVSTELVLLSATRAYSFLGGTTKEYFHVRPNDLLKHEVARWARDHNKSAYVLGGGYRGEDGIYRYKKSFAPRGAREFQVWRYTVNQIKCRDAMSARRAREEAIGNTQWSPRKDFFPPYRG